MEEQKLRARIDGALGKSTSYLNFPMVVMPYKHFRKLTMLVSHEDARDMTIWKDTYKEAADFFLNVSQVHLNYDGCF